jgi:D-alanyl-D-alanine carboxypeptidase
VAPPAPQAAAPKPAAKAGVPGTLPFRDLGPVETKRESTREVIREAARETTPPPTAPVQTAAPQSVMQQPAPHQAATSTHSGWVIQVGAFDGEREARQKLSAVQAKAGPILGHANPFTEAVVKGDKTLYRARFAGLQKDEAEAVCRQLKRNDIDCMTIKN